MKKFLLSVITALLCAVLSLFIPDTAPEPLPFPTETVPQTVPQTVPETTQPTLPAVNPDLVVHYIDVGHADCMLLECAGEYLLIDGGNVEDGELVVSYLNQVGVERLRVVSTHPHEDHVGGLAAVLSVFEVEEIFSPVTDYSSKAFQNFLKKTAEQGLSLTIPAPGDRLSLGNATITVMGPVREYELVNNNSIVLMVSYQNTRFLFAADMERDAEYDMLDYWGDTMNWDCDVLKVGHHGSSSSTRYRLLYEACPEYAVISVGKDNPYGLPKEAPLSRLRDAGVSLFRTDHLGHIIAQSDGQRVLFSWENHNAVPENAEPAEISMQMLYGNTQSRRFHRWNCRYMPVESIRAAFEYYSDAVSADYIPCQYCFN